MKKTPIAVILILASSFLFSQKNKIRFEHITTEQGLSQSSVITIFQDSKGFLWFGTYDGLNRYDGYQFKIYRHLPNNLTSICQNSIRFITEDHFGFLWVGTEEGLSRYDREKEIFKSYYSVRGDSNSLSSNRIRFIYEDKKGVLWVSTDHGLNKYDSKKDIFIRIKYRGIDQNSNSLGFIRAICEDSKGNFWIGTDDGLDLFDRDSYKTITYKHDLNNDNSLSDNIITAVREDSRKTLWIGTRFGGLNRIDNGSKQIKQYKFDPSNPSSIRSNLVRGIIEDDWGDIWVVTYGGGLEKFDRVNERFIHYQNNLFDRFSLSSNALHCITKDREGIIWIGTDFAGINKFDRRKNQFLYYSNDVNDPKSLNVNSVTSFYEDTDEKQSTMWIGTWGGGLSKFDREKEQFTLFRNNPNSKNSLVNDIVRSITKDKDGMIWVGTELGISKFNPATNSFTNYKSDPGNNKSIAHNSIKFVYATRDSEIWIGLNGGGLDKYDPATDSFVHHKPDIKNPYSINDFIVWCIYEDKEGNLWLGTDAGGINRFDKKTGKFTHYLRVPNNPNTLRNNKILCIHGDKEGILWLGSAGGGLNRFDPNTARVKSFIQKDGLPSNTIHAITEDNEGNLWISSIMGLTKFDKKKERFTNFDVQNGLQSLEFHVNSYIKSESGELFFGGINGFNVFRPEFITQNNFIPPIELTDFQINNKSIPINVETDGRIILQKSISETEEIVLSYKDEFFTFQFASLDFTSPFKNQYKYKMDGFDDDWNFVGNRNIASYTNIPPGKYKFIVKGSNHNGVWNEKGTSLILIITPPYWETWLFKLFVFFTVVGLIITGYKVRTRRINERNRELERYVNERSEQLKNTNKELETFSNSVSIDLQQPLYQIDKLGKVFSEKYGNMVDNEGKRILDVIITNSKKMQILINDLLEFSRVGRSSLKKELIDTEKLIHGIFNEILEESKRSKYDIRINHLPKIQGDPLLIKQVWVNLISNAIKFTSKKENPEIIIGCKEKEIETEFFISDNGAGFESHYAHKLYGVFQRLHKEEDYEGTGVGLAIVKRIINRHGGEIWAQGEVDEGASFHFTLPAVKKKPGRFTS